MMLKLLIIPLFEGTLVTLKVFALTLLISLPLSFLIASIQALKIPLINLLLKIFITIERGTPLLLQLMFIFFGLPYLGLTLSRDSSIFVAFILNYTAYFIEIMRGGINAVDNGQKDAAFVLGYSWFVTYFKIILPQAIQNAFPAIANEVMSLIKDTSLITVLGASELLKVGRSAVNTYATALPFIYVAVIYLFLTGMASLIISRIERRLTLSKVGYYVAY